LNRTWLFIWTILNFLHQRTICTMFNLICLLVLEKIAKNCKCISYLSLLSPLGDGGCTWYENFWVFFT
jgi:hypothetical protein